MNKQLDKMGYNIGVRMIEDFLAHTPSAKRCTQFEEVADVICKQGFRMFLGELWRLLNSYNGDVLELLNIIYLYFDIVNLLPQSYIRHS